MLVDLFVGFHYWVLLIVVGLRFRIKSGMRDRVKPGMTVTIVCVEGAAEGADGDGEPGD